MSKSSKNYVKRVRQRTMISQYAKKQCVKAFSLSGSGLPTCRHLVENDRMGNAENFAEFLNNIAKCAQDKVAEEVTSKEFDAVQKWVDHAKWQNIDSNCGLELPLLLKSIAETDRFAECNPETDIDYCLLYVWLAEVMLGNAPPDLNPRSQLFLIENLTELLAEVESSDKDTELKELQEALESPAQITDNLKPFIKSVDPFRLNVKKKLNSKKKLN